MSELDEWAEAEIFKPLYHTWAHETPDMVKLAEHEAKLAIRAKVFESYRNGQEAGP